MRIAVTGASGFVGRSLIDDLLARGHAVRALVRYPDTSLAQLPLETIATGPIEAIADWRPYLTGIDAVVHLAARAHLGDRDMLDAQHIRAVNTTATLSLAKSAAKRKVKHFIYLSSASVHGHRSTPGQPFRDDSPYNPQNNYAHSKADAEQGLRALQSETAMSMTVLRPPLVYGAGARGNFRALCQLVAASPALPFLTIRNQRSFIAADNLTSAFGAVLDKESSGFKPYVICDGKSFSLAGLVRLIAAAQNKKCPLFPAPRLLLLAAAALAGKKVEMETLTQSFEVDAAAFARDFAWTPLIDAESAVRDAASHYSQPLNGARHH